MKTLEALMWALASIAVLGLLGCYGRETVYLAQPQPEYVIVREAPPPVVRERRPSRPSRGYIWIDGNWHWDGQRYVWQHGRWAQPPHERAVWVPPRYERDQQGYRYMPGRWGDQQQERQKEEQLKRQKEDKQGRQKEDKQGRDRG